MQVHTSPLLLDFPLKPFLYLASPYSMKKKYKAILFDVDGTLIPNRKDGTVTQKLIDTVKKAQNSSHIGVATARSFQLLSPISSALGLKGPSIVHGGSNIVNPATKQTLWEKPMDITVAKKLADFTYGLHINFKFYDNGEEVTNVPSYIPYKPYNIWAHKVTNDVVNTYRQFASQFPDIAVHTVPSWEDGKIDFTVSHVLATKQHGVYEIAKLLGIETHEIIGVGDGANDIPLLMACGLKGAMGNAVPELKKIADFIAPSVEEDGAAYIIEKFILA